MNSILVRLVGLALAMLAVEQLISPLRSFDREFEKGRRVFLVLLGLMGLYLLAVGDIRACCLGRSSAGVDPLILAS